MNNSPDNVAQVAVRFNRVYLGDSLIRRLDIDLANSQLTVICTGAAIVGNGDSIFNPEQRYAPARITFEGVQSLFCPEGRYYLNATVVDFGAKCNEDDGLVEFRLEMTGGIDNDSFMRSLVIIASDFSISTA
jgi:hypothetical protein